MQWNFPTVKRVDFVKHLNLLSLDYFKMKNKHLLNSKISLYMLKQDTINKIYNSFER